MADRDSAKRFGEVFTRLAATQTPPIYVIARRMWELSTHYNFAPYQMNCDDALVTLKLARRNGEINKWTKQEGHEYASYVFPYEFTTP